MIFAVLAFILAVPASAGGPLERAARELAAAARAAGVTRVAVEPFESLGALEPALGTEASARLQGFLVRDGRLVAVERSALPRVFAEQAAAGENAPRPGMLAAAQAVLAGSVIETDGRRRVLARLIDSETGEILAAVEGEMPEEAEAVPLPRKEGLPLFRYSRVVDGALALLDGSSGGPEVEERLAGVLEAGGRGGERRAAAALALGRLGDSRSFGLLVSSAEDGDPEVRAASALALGLRGDPAGRPRLDALLRSDPDWRVRDAAAAGLSRARSGDAAAPSLGDLIAEH